MHLPNLLSHYLPGRLRAVIRRNRDTGVSARQWRALFFATETFSLRYPEETSSLYIRFKKNVPRSVVADVTIRRSNFHPYANPIANFTRRCRKTKSTAEFKEVEPFRAWHILELPFHDFIGDSYDQMCRRRRNSTIDKNIWRDKSSLANSYFPFPFRAAERFNSSLINETRVKI